MQTLTVNKVINSYGSLSKIMSDYKLPMNVALKVSKVESEFAIITKTFEDNRKSMLEELGKPNEDGTSYDLGDNVIEFQKRMEELVNEEVDISFDKLPLQALNGKIDEIEPIMITHLDFLIDFDG